MFDEDGLDVRETLHREFPTQLARWEHAQMMLAAAPAFYARRLVEHETDGEPLTFEVLQIIETIREHYVQESMESFPGAMRELEEQVKQRDAEIAAMKRTWRYKWLCVREWFGRLWRPRSV